MDIGHGLDAERSVIWKISWREPQGDDHRRRPYVEAASARTGTHETVFGFQESLKSWRGRYDPETNQVSVVAPEGEPWASMEVPEGVVDNLRKEFGADVEIWHFPMNGKAMMVK